MIDAQDSGYPAFIAGRNKKVDKKIAWLRKHFIDKNNWNTDQIIWFAASQSLEVEELREEAGAAQAQLWQILETMLVAEMASTSKEWKTFETKLDEMAGAGNTAAKRFGDMVRSRARLVAKSGGNKKAEKYKRLQSMTIQLYEDGRGRWKNAKAAATEILPEIVKMSAGPNGNMSKNSETPLRWIRSHNKSTKPKP